MLFRPKLVRSGGSNRTKARMGSMERRMWAERSALILGIASLIGLVGCAAPRTAESVMPVIQVRPGLAERIALMDRYRLHDDERKLMMARPHVWVEEASDEESDDSLEAQPAPEATNETKPAQ